MSSSSPESWCPDPLSEKSITVHFIQHPDYLEAVTHGFVNGAASTAALHRIAEETRRRGARLLLVDTGPLIGQLTKSEHATAGEHVAALFPGVRVAGLLPLAARSARLHLLRAARVPTTLGSARVPRRWTGCLPVRTWLASRWLLRGHSVLPRG